MTHTPPPAEGPSRGAAAYGVPPHAPMPPAYAPRPTGKQLRSMPVPHPLPVTYPHLLRTVTWEQDWWRTLIGGVLLPFWYFAGILLLLPLYLIAVGVQSAVTGESYGDVALGLVNIASGDIGPASMFYINIHLASITWVAFLLMAYLHRMRPGWLTSVAPRMRWRYFWACLGLSVVAIMVSLGLSLVLPGAADDGTGGAVNDFTGELIALAIVILLTTPLQAIGEEYGFRGYLMVALGSLSGWIAERTGITRERAMAVGTVTAIVGTSLLFALAHGVQNFPLFFDRFTFGLIAGVLVVRTGGLEAGIALHVLNNLVAFALAIVYGNVGEALTVSEVSAWNIPMTIAQNGVYLVLCLLVFRRMGLSRHTRGQSDGAPEAVPQAS